METVFNGILFSRDRKRFDQIRESTAGFSELYVGRNIIQDDIFTVIENYAQDKKKPLEWLRFPIDDKELCACTFIRGGRIFVMLNSSLPMVKQIFAAAHELYHIRRFLEDDAPELATTGSILESKTIDIGTTEKEEMEANAFAGLLLAPLDNLEQQIRIYRIDKEKVGIEDILTLIDIFAIPYKAMVLRLLEESIISEYQAAKLISLSSEDIKERMRITGKARRWDMTPVGFEKLGSLLENMTINTKEEALPQSRLESDWKRLEAIKQQYGIE